MWFVFLFLILVVFGGDFQKKRLERPMLSHLNPGNCGGDMLTFAVIIAIQTYLEKNTEVF